MKPHLAMKILRSRSRAPMDFFDDMFEITSPEEVERPSIQTIDEETEKYRCLNISTKFENPLVFWKKSSSEFPKLSAIARQVFVIQASSAESERRFSCAGHIVTEKRGSLDPQTVEMLTFLKSNDWLMSI